MDKQSFEERCRVDPQGLIKDLVAQTTRQANAINTLNKELDLLKKQIKKDSDT